MPVRCSYQLSHWSSGIGTEDRWYISIDTAKFSGWIFLVQALLCMVSAEATHLVQRHIFISTGTHKPFREANCTYQTSAMIHNSVQDANCTCRTSSILHKLLRDANCMDANCTCKISTTIHKPLQDANRMGTAWQRVCSHSQSPTNACKINWWFLDAVYITQRLVKAVRGSASAVRISQSLVNHGRGLVDHAKPLRGINCACRTSTSTNYYTSPYNLLKDVNCTYQTYNSLHKPSLDGNCSRTTNHVEKAFQYIIGKCTSRMSTNCVRGALSVLAELL